MTTLAQPKAPPRTGLHTGMSMSLSDFLALDETEGRWELDYGVLHLMSSGSKDHQFLIRLLCRFIEDYLDGFPQPPAEVHHEITTILSRQRQLAPEPDIAVLLTRRTDPPGAMPADSVHPDSVQSDSVHIEGAPDIVVEILSSNRNRDLVHKRRIYAAAGVPEYWIVDPQNDTVTLLELRAGAYAERATLRAGDTLTTPLLPGLAIPLADIFHHRRRPPRDE